MERSTHVAVARTIELDGERPTIVAHYSAGKLVALHTPLEHGPVGCTWCETPGNRVRVDGV